MEEEDTNMSGPYHDPEALLQNALEQSIRANERIRLAADEETRRQAERDAEKWDQEVQRYRNYIRGHDSAAEKSSPDDHRAIRVLPVCEKPFNRLRPAAH